ncbi:MAG TPA: adenylate kinase [Nitrososphaeraceae archaeon]
MAENNTNKNRDPNPKKRIVVVGIPGIGKTTVISRAAELLRQADKNTEIVVFGTLMFEESKKLGVRNRDELRNLSIDQQRKLQEMAAQKIHGKQADVLLIDTHLFIKTSEGFYPGVPMHLINALRPTHFVMIAADAQEILNRRNSDKTRQRDLATVKEIETELEISKIVVSCCSVISGSPFMIVINKENDIDNAASAIASVIGR